MAQISFLRGGYRGKLGDTIGQFQHGKPIVKAYAKPTNPQSEAQQANRYRFRAANEFAQSYVQLGALPSHNGNDISAFLAERRSFFLSHEAYFRQSLSLAKYPEYPDNRDLFLDYEITATITDDNFVSFQSQFDIGEDDEGNSPYKTAQIIAIIYDYDNAMYYYRASALDTFSRPSVFWDYSAVPYIDLQLPGVYKGHYYPYYLFAVFDDTRYNFEYGQLTDFD